MNLDPKHCYKALESRDERFDGRFFTGVVTTGVYCRPICPARTPRRANVRYFTCAAAAEEAGFRPCKRCRPETGPGTPEWVGPSQTVSRAMRWISEGALDDGSVDDLAERAGVGRRQLNRLFAEHLGASPVSVAQTRRVHFARKLVDETNLRMIDIAFGSGFSSVRRFNTAMKSAFGKSPSELRKSRGRRTGDSRLQLRLPYRTPFDWDTLVGFFEPRALPGVEVVRDGAYCRTIAVGDARGILEVRNDAERRCLLLTVEPGDAASILHVVARVRRIFDLGADPREVDAQLSRDPALRKLIRRRPGLRVPGTWNGFEMSVRAILGQQVSVKGATTLAGRLVEGHGTQLVALEEPGPHYLFPEPEVIAGADLTGIGLPGARAKAINNLAALVASGELDFDDLGTFEEARERLCALPGIGPWTAEYIGLRALGEPDAFPSGDLGLRKALTENGNLWKPKELEKRAEVWRPWRSYATIHLWHSLGSGG